MANPAAEGSKNKDVLASFVLLGATVAALAVANSPLASLYKGVLATPMGLVYGDWSLINPVKSWIKDALMAIFFLLVGLEIKSEFREGALADRQRAILPFVAAAAGMGVPAVIYLAVVSGGEPAYAAGWAIPSATDIAFAVGVIGLLGTRVPAALKAFILAVAVIDDLGAILIIAFFYTASLNMLALTLAFLVVLVMTALNWRHVTALWPYLVLCVVLWFCLLYSGVSATLAGVIAALFVPLHGRKPGEESPLHALAHKLKDPVIFVVMPIFAFANAGVSVGGLGFGDLAHPVTLGIALGLVIGKPIGIAGAVWLMVTLKLSKLPVGATMTQVVGVGFIAGIGFTMSLFVGMLAFADPALIDQVRLGVLAGSFVATLFGIAILLAVGRETAGERTKTAPAAE